MIDLRDGKTRWRLPPGVLGGHLLVHRDGALMTWFDVQTGARVADAVLQAHGRFALVGASQNGREAVLARTETRSTTFALVSRFGERDVSRAGHWRFVALAGPRLTLARGRDGAPSAEARTARWVVSVGPAGTFATDAFRGRRRRLAFSADATYALVPDPDGRHVWAVSACHGHVASLDLVGARIVFAYTFDPGNASCSATIAALSPDGERLAVSDGGHVWVAVPATRSARRVARHVAIALGWSPGEHRLWVVGERSRVSPLPVR